MSTTDFSWGKGGRWFWLTIYHPCSAESQEDPEPLGPPLPVAGYLYFTFTLVSLKSPSSCLLLYPRLLATSISPSIKCLIRQSLCKMWPILLFIVWKIFLSFLTLSNTSSFLTRSVQIIFSIFFQQFISKSSSYFWSTLRSVQFSAQYKAILQTQHFTRFSLKFKTRIYPAET